MPHKKIAACLVLSLACMVQTAFAQKQPWSVWLKGLRQEALAQGIRPAVFDKALKGVRPKKQVIKNDRNQPEHRLTFLEYRNSRAKAYRIQLGQREYKKHRQLLTTIGQSYGVDPCILTALWGLETSYGRFMGHSSTIAALATLAYDPRRGKFFRRELLFALKIVNEGHVNLKTLKGEWAGGTGQPQFLPSSWYHYAVDYNKDGKKDIWTTYSDVFASIANYLVENGWQRNQPWGQFVTLQHPVSSKLLGLKAPLRPLSYWLQQPIDYSASLAKMPRNRPAWLVTPYGGPAIVAFKNFKVIMRWNRSTYYAGTVGYLADKICRR